MGNAVLDIIMEEGLQQRAQQVGLYTKGLLSNLLVKHRYVGDVRGLGLFLGVEIVQDQVGRWTDMCNVILCMM